jgi:hypothetical protein
VDGGAGRASTARGRPGPSRLARGRSAGRSPVGPLRVRRHGRPAFLHDAPTVAGGTVQQR